MIIKNSEGLVMSITQPGIQQADSLRLSVVSGQGAKGIKAEEMCAQSYSQGIHATQQAKANLRNLYDYMNQISDTLKAADEQVIKNIKAGETR